jgi:predicted transcriptional regulator
MSKGDIVISLEPKFVARIVNGRKTAELRRRVPRIEPGCRVWIYTKAPEAVVSVCVIVEKVVVNTPDEIWSRHCADLGVSKEEFQSYFTAREVGCAIFFKAVRGLSPAVLLSELKSITNLFHPPQFFKWLREDGPELKLLQSRLRTCDNA